MDLLRDHPEATEMCVENVLFLRKAEAEGRADDALKMLSGAH